MIDSVLSQIRSGMNDVATRAGSAAQASLDAVGNAVSSVASTISESKPVEVVSDSVTTVASTVSDVVVGGATLVSDAAVGTARTVIDFASSTATGVADAVTTTLSSGKQAISETADHYRDDVEDGLWAVQRPIIKTGTVTAGMAIHLAPVLVEKALSRLMPSAFLGPLAPIGKLIAIIELVGDARRAAGKLGELMAEADRDLDEATRKRLETRQFKAEERLAELLTAPSGGGNREIVAIVAAADGVPGNVAMDARLMTGLHADRRLSNMSRGEVEAAIGEAQLPETRQLLEAWLRARGMDAKPAPSATP